MNDTFYYAASHFPQAKCLVMQCGHNNLGRFYQISSRWMSVSSHSSHFGNFVSGCFWQWSYQNITYSLFIFRFILPIFAHLAFQMENIGQKIMQPKWRKTKNKVTKICNEPGNSENVSNQTIHCRQTSKWLT